MEHAHAFLANLALVLCAAAVTTIVFQWLRLPVVLGYLLAGLLVSPHTPVPIFADEAMVHTLSELGVVLLMFTLGLEFSLKRLARVAQTGGVVAIIEVSFMIWLGFVVGRAFGWSSNQSIFLGAIIAISSTTIIAKVFAEHKVDKVLSDGVYGILIAEDLLAVVLVTVLSALAASTAVSATVLLWTIGRFALFLAGIVVIGLFVVPRVVRIVAKLSRPETTVIASIGICFAAALAAQAAGYSTALGAFLGGSLVAESGKAKKVEHQIEPIRDMFAAIFFVSVGMSIDPKLIAESWALILVLTALVVLGKTTGVSIASFLSGTNTRDAIRTGMSMAQIGEFSFIIAGVGVALGASQKSIYPIAVAVSALTTLATPFMVRASTTVAPWIDDRLPRPLQTFASLYGSWLARLRSTPHAASFWAQLRRLLVAMLFDAAALAGVIIGTSLAIPHVVHLAEKYVSLGPNVSRIGFTTIAFLVSIPFVLGLVRCAKRLGWVIATEALPAPGPDATTQLMHAGPPRALVLVVQLAVVLLIGAPLVTVTEPFLPSLTGAALLTSVLALLGWAFWRSANDLEGKVRAGTELVLEVLAKQTHNPGSTGTSTIGPEVEKAVNASMPWFEGMRSIHLAADSPAVGKTLADLGLRARTGATVIAIIHEGQSAILPSAHEVLREGDTLALAGSTQAIAAAELVLSVSNLLGEATKEGEGEQTAV